MVFVVLLKKSALGSIVIWEDIFLWEGYFFIKRLLLLILLLFMGVIEVIIKYLLDVYNVLTGRFP